MAIRPEGIVNSDIQVKLLEAIVREASLDLFNFIQTTSTDKSLSYKNKLEQLKKLSDKYNLDTRAWADVSVPNFYQEGMQGVFNNILKNDLLYDNTASFGTFHEKALESLMQNSYSYLDNISSRLQTEGQIALSEAQKFEISKELGKGLVTGEDRRLISDKVEKILKTTQNGKKDLKLVSYAKMLSRSTLTEAQWQGTSNSMAQSGYDLVQVSDHFGECGLCRPFENQILSINGMYPQYTRLETATSQGLKHNSCLLDWNEVLTSEGTRKIGEIRNGATVIDMFGIPTKVISKMVKDYSGVIYTITSSNFNMAGTPDHSALTEYGWTFFEDLRIGQKLMQDNGDEREIIINGRVINSKNLISFIQEKFTSLRVSDFTYPIVMSSPVAFNDNISDNKIRDILPNSLLMFKDKIVSSQNIDDDRFILVGIPSQEIAETLALFFFNLDSTLISSIVDKVLLATSSRNVEFFHNVLNRGGGFVPTNFSDLLSRFALFVIDPSQEFFDISKLIVNILFDSFVHIDNVIADNMETKVYDIETNGTYQLSNNIISHNCRHTILPYFDRFASVSKVWDVESQSFKPMSEVKKQDYNFMSKFTNDKKEKEFLRLQKNLGLVDYPQVNQALKNGDKKELLKISETTDNKKLAIGIKRMLPYVNGAISLPVPKDNLFDLKKELTQPSVYKIKGLTKYFDKTAELYNIKIVQDKEYKGFGEFDAKKNIITINPNRKGKLVTYLHELGHGIDYHTSGGFGKEEVFGKLYSQTLRKDVDQIMYHKIKSTDLELLGLKTLTYERYQKELFNLPLPYIKYISGKDEIFGEGFGQYKANPEKFKKYAPTLFDYFSKVDKDVIDKLK
jgi:hypothetical protein